MRILFYSDDVLMTTGFGIELRNIVTRLAKLRPSWDLGCSHWAGFMEPARTTEGYTLISKVSNDHYTNAKYYIETFKPDYFMTLYDVWVSHPFMYQLSQKSGFSNTRWISYFVFDILRNSAPHVWQQWWDSCDVPVAMSKYGQQAVLENWGVEPSQIYHGVDREIFKPLPAKEVEERRKTGLHNPEIVIGGFFRNILRKQAPRLFEAFSHVGREYPDTVLFLNMLAQDPQGYDLVHYAQKYNIEDSVIYTSQVAPTLGMPVSLVNLAYNLADFHVLPTMGEGFGKPIIEAYAANGLPCIMTDCTTYDELVGDHGLPIATENDMMSRGEGAQPIPSVKSMEEQMRIMIDDKNLRRKFSDHNREFAKEFDYDMKIMPKWLELFDMLEGQKT